MTDDSQVKKDQLCIQLVKAGKRMADLRLVRGSSGNLSVKYENGMLITASGIAYSKLTTSQIIEINLDGDKKSGLGSPSSEWRMHAGIYKARDDVAAIVHTHSPYATAVAIARKSLPMVHDEGRILFGEKVPVAAHTAPGSPQLAAAAVEALGTGKGRASCRSWSGSCCTRHSTSAIACREARRDGRTLLVEPGNHPLC